MQINLGDAEIIDKNAKLEHIYWMSVIFDRNGIEKST
jgi:hypothetical protein